MFSESRPTSEIFPLINAVLNGTAGLLLWGGYVLIKQQRIEAHKKAMMAALACSALFLASYLYYHFNFRSQKYHGAEFLRIPYYIMLVSHVFLATFNLPFILRTFYLGYRKKDYVRHKRLARWVWPVWIYVSVTGVLIYLMLYS